MWRPDDWDNGWDKQREEDGMASKAEIFEAGADAMLEAVVKYLEARWTQYWSNPAEGISRHTFKLPEHWQKVFIPDDDTD